jgi:hypothetical protein
MLGIKIVHIVSPRLEMKLHTQRKLRDLYSSPSVIGMTKSQALCWDGRVQ